MAIVGLMSKFFNSKKLKIFLRRITSPGRDLIPNSFVDIAKSFFLPAKK